MRSLHEFNTGKAFVTSARATAIHALFFGPGATTLGFEVVWLRRFAIESGLCRRNALENSREE
jgi:hypothetical protein